MIRPWHRPAGFLRPVLYVPVMNHGSTIVAAGLRKSTKPVVRIVEVLR